MWYYLTINTLRQSAIFKNNSKKFSPREGVKRGKEGKEKRGKEIRGRGGRDWGKGPVLRDATVFSMLFSTDQHMSYPSFLLKVPSRQRQRRRSGVSRALYPQLP